MYSVSPKKRTLLKSPIEITTIVQPGKLYNNKNSFFSGQLNEPIFPEPVIRSICSIIILQCYIFSFIIYEATLPRATNRAFHK